MMAYDIIISYVFLQIKCDVSKALLILVLEFTIECLQISELYCFLCLKIDFLFLIPPWLPDFTSAITSHFWLCFLS